MWWWCWWWWWKEEDEAAAAAAVEEEGGGFLTSLRRCEVPLKGELWPSMIVTNPCLKGLRGEGASERRLGARGDEGCARRGKKSGPCGPPLDGRVGAPLGGRARG